MAYQRKNRKTKGIVMLCMKRVFHEKKWRWTDWYWLRCEHGTETQKVKHRSYAIDSMAHPDRWCSSCEDIVIHGRGDG